MEVGRVMPSQRAAEMVLTVAKRNHSN
jgi:hypothetical protein